VNNFGHIFLIRVSETRGWTITDKNFGKRRRFLRDPRGIFAGSAQESGMCFIGLRGGALSDVVGIFWRETVSGLSKQCFGRAGGDLFRPA
jgi:hypothetical protein